MNETTLTITGNLVDDPELRFTPCGPWVQDCEEPSPRPRGCTGRRGSGDACS